MEKLRVVLGVGPPLWREVLEYLLEKTGVEVVAHSSSFLELLLCTELLRPDAVFMWISTALGEPGICSHLLHEYEQLNIVLLSCHECQILRGEHETDRLFDPSLHSIRTAVSKGLSR